MMSRVHKCVGRRRAGGFSLIELMMVVAMIFILGAIGGVAWSRYIKRARTTEAAGHIQKMWAGAFSYYETDHGRNDSTQVLNKQFPGSCGVSLETDCCQNPDQRCPGNASVYALEPWRSLHFNIADKHLYRPVYWACPDSRLNIWMEVWGDLDCDTQTSRFIFKANVQPNGEVERWGATHVINETE